MKTITIHSEDEVSRTVACDDINGEGKATTIHDVCGYEAVVDFFDSTAEDIAASLVGVNGTEISEGLLGRVLKSAVEDQDDLIFSLSIAKPDDEQDDARNDNGTAQKGTGVCTVYLSAGIQSVNLDIELGRTTLQDVIHNDVVRARSGMSDAQLTSCTVFVNNEEVPAAAIAQRLVRDGDQIELSARPVHTKG